MKIVGIEGSWLAFPIDEIVFPPFVDLVYDTADNVHFVIVGESTMFASGKWNFAGGVESLKSAGGSQGGEGVCVLTSSRVAAEKVKSLVEDDG